MIKETFDEACSAFTDFLRNSGQSYDLQWICRDDVTGSHCKLFVHPSPPPINRELYRHYYEFGVRQKRGVRLDVLCFTSGRAYCYVWVPENDLAAEQAMVSDSLSMSYRQVTPESKVDSQAVRCSTAITFQIKRLGCKLQGETRIIQEIPRHSKLKQHLSRVS